MEVRRMEKEYDFSKAVKRPSNNMVKGKYLVTIEHRDGEEHFEVEMPKFRKLTPGEKAALIEKAI
jgi:hypothetical protein